MKLSRLEPSSHVKGRVLLHMEDGSLLKVTENEVLRFSLYPVFSLVLFPHSRSSSFAQSAFAHCSSTSSQVIASGNHAFAIRFAAVVKK